MLFLIKTHTTESRCIIGPGNLLFLIKTHTTESRCLTGPENILFLRRVRVSFSPEILQAGAVRGLKVDCTGTSLLITFARAFAH